MEVIDKWFAIVNPISGKGKGLLDWPMVSKLLRDNGIMPDFVFTEHRYHAIELTVEAISKGYRRIMAVGGDGTMHEVVNGIFIQKAVPTTDILVAAISVGTGNDWTRMYGIPRQYAEAIQAIVKGHSILQDVAVASYYESLYNQHRYVANNAGCGLDAVVNRRCFRMKERGYRGRLLYLWSLVQSVFTYRSTRMKIWVDDRLVWNSNALSATFGIGKYNGGGMMQLPYAEPDDGLLDLTVIGRLSRLEIVRHAHALFNGKIYEVKKVRHWQGRKIRIESVPTVEFEIDGEPSGEQPIDVEILEKAIHIIVSEQFIRQREKSAAKQISKD